VQVAAFNVSTHLLTQLQACTSLELPEVLIATAQEMNANDEAKHQQSACSGRPHHTLVFQVVAGTTSGLLNHSSEQTSAQDIHKSCLHVRHIVVRHAKT
jgi:hypothetical protein